MAAAGIEFGSHTVTHPILSRVTPTQLAHELGYSKSRIESELGRPVDVIAYPVGREEGFDDAVRKAVAEAGYKLGVSYVQGCQSPAEWDPLAVRRVHVERDTTAEYFRSMMAAPTIFK